jgi:hypothetical protein
MFTTDAAGTNKTPRLVLNDARRGRCAVTTRSALVEDVELQHPMGLEKPSQYLLEPVLATEVGE